ncbi:MAG: S8 family serine peptidase [Crocinitomicaceae bacterium]|nr:S8 family serine peptidase [Crocinitomicaceae bacterium]
MKNNYFAKIGALICFFAFAITGTAQTVYTHYVDGMIWVKLSENVVQKKTMSLDGTESTNYHDLDLASVPFLHDLSRSVNFTRIEQPYHHIEEKGLNRIYRLTFDDPTQVNYVIESLNQQPSVEYAEKIAILEKTLTPNDPDYNPSEQWSLFQINAGTAWDLSIGDADVVVAIVDDAVEITHSDLSAVTWTNSGEIAGNGIDDDGNGYIDDVNGYDVADLDNDPNPDAPISSFDHGTHVAGIAGATTNNSNGMASIGHGISLMAVKATNSPSVVSNGYDGIVYAVNSGADVINCSWGGPGFSTTAQTIIDFAYDNDALVIAAAGNDNVSSMFYPAAYDHVISVASSTFGDSKSSFSNYGSWIDITAPGSAIWSTVPGNSYAIKQGTSMASPLVAGLAGLMLSMNPGLLPDDIEACLLSSADDIDAANPSYIGDLGAGRINALEALNCISSTLDYPPVAEFVADFTTIVEGGSVNFTDLSYYSPDTWEWTFTGGTPASFTGENPPPIIYSTPGTYPVSLEVSNVNGDDTETKAGYIIVNDLSGCDTITNTIDTDGYTTWSWGTGGVDGFIGGHNTFGTDFIAERYTGYGPTNVMGATFAFVDATAASPTSTLRIVVWDEVAGEPGSEVYSQEVSMAEIEDNAAGTGAGTFFFTTIRFESPAVVPTSNFYIGYELDNVSGDEINCALTGDLVADPRPNTIWYYFADIADDYGPGWVEVSGGVSATGQWSMHCYPWITDSPPDGIITSNSPVCEGEYMDFDGSTSVNTVNWDWAINGTGTPYPTGSDPSVIMNEAGNHWAYMAAYNHCGIFVIDSLLVTVDETPDVMVTSTADTLCPGGSSFLVASGADSYVWSPATGLSCTTCSNPEASPTSSTTYAVTGTIGSCTSDSFVEIEVDDEPPVADFIMSKDTVCEGLPLDLNGAISDNAASWDWTLTGADVTSASGATATATYSTPGTYTITLDVENSCSETDNISKDIFVESALTCFTGISSDDFENGIATYLNRLDEIIYVQFGFSIDSDVTIELISVTGQLVYQETMDGVLENTNIQVPVHNLNPALYLLRVSSETNQTVEKFIIE